MFFSWSMHRERFLAYISFARTTIRYRCKTRCWTSVMDRFAKGQAFNFLSRQKTETSRAPALECFQPRPALRDSSRRGPRRDFNKWIVRWFVVVPRRAVSASRLENFRSHHATKLLSPFRSNFNELQPLASGEYFSESDV